METYVRNFLRSSLVWLGIGVTIGIAMVFAPYHALAYRPAHMHANLLGFVSMMIFGVAYHVLPRFTGRPLRRPGLARVHLLCGNAGLALMVGGFLARVAWPLTGRALLAAGGVASASAAFLFITNIWYVLSTRSPRETHETH
jgi:heme/copper-type cytochrome/quinol oxidase subunit 1